MGDTSISKDQAREFLQSQFIMNLSTMSEDRPHASVLLYAMDDDFSFYMVTHTDTYKANNILAHPHVSFTIWEHGTMMIQADALASEITDQEKKDQTIEKLSEAAASDTHFWPPLLRIGGDNYVVFKLTPYWMRALDLASDTISAKESPFSEILHTAYEQ